MKVEELDTTDMHREYRVSFRNAHLHVTTNSDLNPAILLDLVEDVNQYQHIDELSLIRMLEGDLKALPDVICVENEDLIVRLTLQERIKRRKRREF